MADTEVIQHILNPREAMALAAVATIGVWALEDQEILRILASKNDQLLWSALRMLIGIGADEGVTTMVHVANAIGGPELGTTIMLNETINALQGVRAKIGELVAGVAPEYRDKVAGIRNPLRG